MLGRETITWSASYFFTGVALADAPMRTGEVNVNITGSDATPSVSTATGTESGPNHTSMFTPVVSSVLLTKVVGSG